MPVMYGRLLEIPAELQRPARLALDTVAMLRMRTSRERPFAMSATLALLGEMDYVLDIGIVRGTY